MTVPVQQIRPEGFLDHTDEGKYRQSGGKELIGVVKYCTARSPVIFFTSVHDRIPDTVAALFQAWVCGRSLAKTVGSKSLSERGCLSLVSVLCVVR